MTAPQTMHYITNIVLQVVVLIACFINPAKPSRAFSAKPNCTPDRKIIDLLGIMNGSSYDRNKVPELGMSILVGARVQAVSQVNDVTQDFVLDVFMAESWIDERLAFKKHNPCRNNISLGKDMYSKIWTPNTCFINSKKAYIHASPFKNMFLMVFDKGFIWTEYRATLTGAQGHENFRE